MSCVYTYMYFLLILLSIKLKELSNVGRARALTPWAWLNTPSQLQPNWQGDSVMGEEPVPRFTGRAGERWGSI